MWLLRSNKRIGFDSNKEGLVTEALFSFEGDEMLAINHLLEDGRLTG
jgi:hypothetical protein